MSIPAISVEGLSKRYILGQSDEGRDALRHVLERAMRNPLRWLMERRRQTQQPPKEFWALKNLTFEINQGDVVGVIGRNGAGKSTLLKVLSQITEPTKGRIRLKGRVASLLEVGTGFHQELTGRENIFLNGAILGMTKAEIKSKFDQIVAFSEVEEFLDTPVKRYSSGMYVRLAFAVAAHLEPEILIVDEVLAVGDAAFQKKCLGKMGEVAGSGRTILFVSHNMAAVQALCTKAIRLKEGTLQAVGDVDTLVNQYLAENNAAQGMRFKSPLNLGDSIKLLKFDLSSSVVESGSSLKFSLTFQAEKPTAVTELQLLVYTAQNIRISMVDFREYGLPSRLAAGQIWHLKGEIPSLPFVEGDYSLGLYINTGTFLSNFFDLVNLTISPRQTDSNLAPYPLMYRGLVELKSSARVEM